MNVAHLGHLPRNQIEQNDPEYQTDRPMRKQAKHEPKANVNRKNHNEGLIEMSIRVHGTHSYTIDLQ